MRERYAVEDGFEMAPRKLSSCIDDALACKWDLDVGFEIERRVMEASANGRLDADAASLPRVSATSDHVQVASPRSGLDEPFQLAPGERWFVVQALARREAKAQFHLRQQGFRVFLPVVTRTVRHARKTRSANLAAFPGYLFVALDLLRHRWRSVNGTFGVSRLVMGDSFPLPVPPGIVETLLDYRDKGGVCRFDRDLVVGQPVRVMSGPLAEALGKLVRLDGAGRVQVLLEILGGHVRTTLDRAALEAA